MVCSSNKNVVFLSIRFCGHVTTAVVFVKRKDGIKFLSIEVQKFNVVLAVQVVLNLLKNSSIETFVVWVGVND